MPAPRAAYDFAIVGAGPNGLAAGIELARAGRSVLIREAQADVGGAARSGEFTLSGLVHDFGSAVYPLGVGSPFLSQLPLCDHGLAWTHAPAPLAHPLDDGPALVLERSVARTARTLRDDGDRYRSLVETYLPDWTVLAPALLGPLRLPRHPGTLVRFGLRGIRSLDGLVRSQRMGGPGAALLAGNAAHAGLALSAPGTAAFALVLHLAAHAVGWPVPTGGAGRLTAAMASYFRALGGVIEMGRPVRDLRELPASRGVLLDLTPRQILHLLRDRLPPRYRRGLEAFRYGAAAFKVDWALSGPIPWRDNACARAVTVHLAGTHSETAEALHRVSHGERPVRPFVILAQPSLHDPTRAPAGMHTAWAYCHVPNGATWNMTDAIEAQIERFAPGFRDLVVARHVLTPQRLEDLDANLVGGDFNGGSPVLRQLLFRPVVRWDPYSTPVPGLFICSASTPPGGGVHGMCGYHAARSALRWLDGTR